MLIATAVHGWGLQPCTVHAFSGTISHHVLVLVRRETMGTTAARRTLFQHKHCIQSSLPFIHRTELRQTTDNHSESNDTTSTTTTTTTTNMAETAITTTSTTSVESNNNNINNNNSRREVIFIEPGTEGDLLSEDLWEEIDGAQPPQWVVMKQVRACTCVCQRLWGGEFQPD